jgi:RimJ/RimL family protein N-acetyltransferase
VEPMELRDVIDSDYATFFALLGDEASARMAAFGTKDASANDLAARWKRSLANGATSHKAIVVDGDVVGFIATFFLERDLQVTYWVARSHWGRGIATAALTQFLPTVATRPLYASAARDNVGSLRVLQKCGFTIRGSERAFANARGEEIDEVFLVLAP